MTNSHLIGKQIMELEISSSKNAYTIQQTISDLVWNVLVPKMSDLFDSIVGDEEVIKFDKIELDLGEISLQENNIDTIVDQLMRLLRKQCTERIQEINEQKRLHPKSSENQNCQPLRSYYFTLWLHWLVHGTLINYAVTPKENWLDEVMVTLALEDSAIEQLKTLLHKYPMALDRLILQHKTKELKSLVELYTGFSQTKLIDFFKEIHLFLKQKYPDLKSHGIRAIEVNLWKTVFRHVILKRAKVDSCSISKIIVQEPEIWIFKDKYVSQTQKTHTKLFPMLSEAFQKTVNNSITNNSSKPNKISNSSDSNNDIGSSSSSSNGSVSIDKDKKAEPNSQKTAKNPLCPEIVKSISPKASNTKKIEELSSPQFFASAGMVLLHPFLRHLFKKLNLLNDTTFKDFDSQCKAVLLLHFLAGGEDAINDYELVLPKFLCAMPPNLPLDYTLKISALEKEEGTNLLQAVIDHWGALGTSSPDGLREGFLIRKGKLRKDHTGWKLHVEQNTLDILLDKLPWNLSMVKLPWMQELLYVEWH